MSILLETLRLILRPLEERDLASFCAYRSDPEVARYQGWDAPFSLEQAADFVRAMQLQSQTPGQARGWCQLVLERKADGVMIGDVFFKILTEDPRQAEIGFTLARAYQGQGYAREAVRALLDYLFTCLDLHRVRANCDPENYASAHLMASLGMRHEGRWVESLWFKGHWAGEDWYAILQREWQNKNS